MKRARAVFLDRDGVIIEDEVYLARPEQMRMIAGAGRAVARLRKAGFKTIVVSNQSGVARGFFTEADVRRVHRDLARRLKKQGAVLDAVYYCPHHPLGTLKRYRRKCACRKPGIGMLRRAAKRFRLDLSACWLVGDKRSDILAGLRAGCGTVLVRTGEGGRDRDTKVKADRTCADLAEAARWIVRSELGADRRRA